MKKILSYLCVIAVISAITMTVCFADFTTAAFENDDAYIITVNDAGNTVITADEEISIKTTESNLSKEFGTARMQIEGSNSTPFVMSLVITCKDGITTNSQAVNLSTYEHTISFTPAVGSVKGEYGKLETLKMNFYSEEMVKTFLEDLATDKGNGIVSILTSEGMVSGDFAVENMDVLLDMLDLYCEAGGFNQYLDEAKKETTAEMYETILVKSGEVVSDEGIEILKENEIRVTSHPGDGKVTEGGYMIFTATAENFVNVQWYIVSADGRYKYTVEEAPYHFSGLAFSGAGTQQLTLANCPISLNGCKLYAEFAGMTGNVDTNYATITIEKAPSVRIWASPSAGYFTNIQNAVYINGERGSKIHYELYRGNTLIRSGEIYAGECVWVEGISGQINTVNLYAYVVGDRNNSITCSYTVDAVAYGNGYYVYW